jgi:UDP-N-acetylglucosamine:LPS N-acetylglucosamine transferase
MNGTPTPAPVDKTKSGFFFFKIFPESRKLLSRFFIFLFFGKYAQYLFSFFRRYFASSVGKETQKRFLSTGAGVGVPFIIIARLLRIRTIYLESITRNEELSLSALLVYPFVNDLLVQWRDLEILYSKAQYRGQVI